ncbi:unnamed protein product, partial [Coregonus sp. 'balchen']
MTHMEAQNRIKACMGELTLAISRSEDKVLSPTVIEDGKTSPFMATLESESTQNFRPISSGPITGGYTSGYSSGYNSSGYSRKPSYISEPPHLNNGTSKQYNNPAGLYAHNNGNNGDRDRVLPKQMGGLSLSSPHSPEPPMHSPLGRNGNAHSFEVTTESDVYKMLQDPEEPVSAPKQSGSFKYLQGILEAEDGGVSPTDRSGQKGYFFIEENLYCETHAMARVQPPEGYDVVAVYPNSKVELLLKSCGEQRRKDMENNEIQ